MGHFLEPLTIIWLLMGGSFAVMLYRRQWRAAWLPGGLAGLICLLGNSPLIDRLVSGCERPYAYADMTRLAPADAVVALGSGSLESPESLLGFSLGQAGTERCLTALQLSRLGKARVVVLGGGEALSVRVQQSQMVLVQSWVQAWRLAPGAVTNLGICANTHDEAVRYAQLAAANKWKRTLLVTSALHVKRAEAVFKKLGVPVTPIGCDFHDSGLAYKWTLFPIQDRFALWSLYLHEQIGTIVYRLRGWI
jgi:uncharacterized SAM-binding protein YcdF (DUF218 family)